MQFVLGMNQNGLVHVLSSIKKKESRYKAFDAGNKISTAKDIDRHRCQQLLLTFSCFTKAYQPVILIFFLKFAF